MSGSVPGIAGRKNAGKTTLTTRLGGTDPQGLKDLAVEQAHQDADIDREGSDSFLYRQAGAVEVALVASLRWTLKHELREEAEPSLAEILARLVERFRLRAREGTSQPE